MLRLQCQRITLRENAAERQEDAGHSEPRVTEHAAEGSEPSQREAWRSNERVRIEHADERDVHEEALRPAFGVGEGSVLEVRVHDAGVMSSIPAAAGRFRDELQP